MSFDNVRKQVHSHLTSKGYEYHGSERHGSTEGHTWKKGPKHIHITYDHLKDDGHVSVSVPHKVQYTRHKMSSFKPTDIKEETINEISKELVKRYVKKAKPALKKATKDLNALEKKHGNLDRVSTPEVNKAHARYDGRLNGLDRAKRKHGIEESNMTTFIDLVAEQNATEFQTQIKSRLKTLSESALADKKKQIASSMFEGVSVGNIVPALVAKLKK